MAALVVLKNDDLAGGVQGGVKVLQKQLFGPGVRVKGKVQHGGLVVLQQAPRCHDTGRLRQREVPPGAGCPADEDHVACRRALGAQHKGAPHGAHYAFHKGILPEDALFHLGGKALKAAQLFRRHIGGAFGQQAVGLHVPQHPAAVFQRRLRGGVLGLELGVLLFQQLVQLALVLLQCGVQVRQGAACGLCGLRLLPRLCAAEFELAARAEHTVHKGFPIIGICHTDALRLCRFSSV